MIARVEITAQAAELVSRLASMHGPLIFHQSFGCCDRSSPICCARGGFRVGQQDVLLGEIAGHPFYIGADRFALWRHTQLIVDVVVGRGSGFSLEVSEGVRFVTRRRVFTNAEFEVVDMDGDPTLWG